MRTIFYNPLYESESELALLGCGREKCDFDFSDGPSIRNSYILHYIISGKGYYEVDGHKYALKKGDVFAIYPDDLVTYYTDKDDPWEFCWIIFGGTRGRKYYHSIGISHSRLVISNVDKAFATSITDCLKYIDENPKTYSQLRLVSCMLECFSHIEKATYAERHVPSNKNHVQNAIAYIEYNYGRGINIKDVSDQLGLERTYFYRIFKKETGKTPNEYLTEYRIKKAKSLIALGVDFKNIANSIGLNDVYYFSKLFKKTTGLSPSEYRNKILTTV